MIHIHDDHLGCVKSIFVHISNSKSNLLAIASSIQSKLRHSEKKQTKLTGQPSCHLHSFTIQNQPTLKSKRADYLGLAIVEENRATKVNSN